VSGRPTSVIYYGTPVLAINRVRPNLGLYGQDQWTLKRMTLNAGLRFDWTDPNGDRIVQGDPFNPLANDELGRSLNLNFGKPVLAFCYDRDWAFGFQNRAYNWEFSTGIQQEIVPSVSVSATYFRRIYGNFGVTENTAVTAADYDPFCVTAPTDAPLPTSGQQICGMFDLHSTKLGQVSTLGTAAANYGEQFDHWNGVDFTMNARLPKVLLQGGVSTGKTLTDNCAITRTFPQDVRHDARPDGRLRLAEAPGHHARSCGEVRSAGQLLTRKDRSRLEERCC